MINNVLEDTILEKENCMKKSKIERRTKEEKPVVAICYDFDKTLSPDDMQAQGYIQSVGFDIKEFWTQSNQLAENNDMDQNLAYMYKMVDEARGNLILNRKALADYGSKVKLFQGVDTWFERIREYGNEKGVIIEHYIISSGLKEMIEGTEMACNNAFEKIYASSFYFDNRGEAKWPAQVINYTNKTQFLFRIEKGILDINDPGVNDYFTPDKIRIPFGNMVYIGDSDTDIPCMKLINSYGGYSVGVYNPETKDKTKVYNMITDNRIKFFAPADYTDQSELDILVKMIIDRTATNSKIDSLHFQYKNEVINADRVDDRDEDDKNKDKLIEGLRDSRSFAMTHQMVSELKKYNKWNDEQKEALCSILVDNSQVSWILGDEDVYDFYLDLVAGIKPKIDLEKEILKMLEDEANDNEDE